MTGFGTHSGVNSGKMISRMRRRNCCLQKRRIYGFADRPKREAVFVAVNPEVRHKNSRGNEN